MKKIIYFVAASLVALLSSCERIDAGCEGILVQLYGDDRGVDDVAMVSGWVHYNPFVEQVFEYPTYVQTVDYPSFTINAKDGSEFTVDPTISLKVINGRTPEIFKKYRRDVPYIIEGPLFNHVRDAFRIQLNKFTTDEIVSMRDSLEKAVERQISSVLTKEGFQLEQLTSGLKYPESIVQAVNAKNKAVQEAQKAQNELMVAEAEAKKLLVKAQAQHDANELLQQSLTPLLIKKMTIDKWDGQLPTVVNGGDPLSIIVNQ